VLDGAEREDPRLWLHPAILPKGIVRRRIVLSDNAPAHSHPAVMKAGE